MLSLIMCSFHNSQVLHFVKAAGTVSMDCTGVDTSGFTANKDECDL